MGLRLDDTKKHMSSLEVALGMIKLDIGFLGDVI